MFVNAGSGDFSLQSNSPCIGAGSNGFDMGYTGASELGGIYGCTDSNACNYNPDATEDNGSCEYPEENFDCDGNCLIEIDCYGECGGTAVEDCSGECGGVAAEDECGICDGENTCADVTSCEIGEGEVVPYIPFSTIGNTTGLTKDFTNADEYFNSSGGDYVYELNLNQYSILNISTCGAGELGFDPVITFYQFDDDCNVSFIAGNDDYSGSGYNYSNGEGLTDEEFACTASPNSYIFDAALFGLALEAGNYMLVVSGFAEGEGQFPLTIEYADEDRVASIFPSYDEFINQMRIKAYDNNDDMVLDFPENISFEVTSSNQRDECNFVVGPDAGCDGVCFSEATLDECGTCDNNILNDCVLCDEGFDIIENECFLIGDVNQDDYIDIVDVITIIQITLGIYESTETEFRLSDFNYDDLVDISDIVAIINYILEN